MKKFTLIFVFLFLAPTLSWGNDAFAKIEGSTKPPKIKKSTISKVTVFLSGAQIERTAKVSLAPGNTTLLFDNLSNDIDENSIQISGLGNASILSVNFGINYLTEQMNSKKVDSLQLIKTSLETQILKLENAEAGLAKEEEVINVNKQLGSSTVEIDITKVKSLSTYYRSRITEIRNELLDLSLQKMQLQRQVSDLSRQFNELNITEEKSKGQITLKLNDERAENLDLIIRYNVSKAGWFPEYDLKAVSIDAPLDLSYKAHLYQQTGISWEDVNLVLSTGDPSTNNIKPDLETKYLNFVSHSYRNIQTTTKAYNYKYNPNIKTVTGTVTEGGVPLPGANVIVKGTSNGTQTDFDGNYSIQVSDGEKLLFSYIGYSTKELPIHASIINANLETINALDEVVVMGYGTENSSRRTRANSAKDVSTMLESKAAGIKIRGNNSLSGLSRKETATGDIKTEGITNTKFTITKKYSIESDGDVTVIEIDKFQVPAAYNYYVAPGVNENVFLTASIKDWVKYSLLPGEANVYFEGSFSGKTYINPLETTEELSVSLGVDPSITVKRKQLDNFKSKSFIGGQRIIDMGYEITIKNNKSKAITVKMEDRIPISQNKEIKVDDIETGDALFNKDTGMMQWEVKLQPSSEIDSSRSTIKKSFSYQLKYPKHKRINI